MTQNDRIWVLGAADPEMEAIEALLVECGETVVYATVDGVRVHPGTAYRASEPDLVDSLNVVIFAVECGWKSTDWRTETPVIIDHHRLGDPGFGRHPSEFFEASSIGQVCSALYSLGLLPFDLDNPPDHILLTASADHCLGAAYRGECPGVDPNELMAFRASGRARFQSRAEPGVTAETILQRINETQSALRSAPEIVLQTVPDDRDQYGQDPEWSGYPPVEFGSRDITVRDMRRDLPWPELSEAATRLGIGYMSGPLIGPDGRQKFTCSGTKEQVEAWIDWARRNGLVDSYGDPTRGFAGAYQS